MSADSDGSGTRGGSDLPVAATDTAGGGCGRGREYGDHPVSAPAAAVGQDRRSGRDDGRRWVPRILLYGVSLAPACSETTA